MQNIPRTFEEIRNDSLPTSSKYEYEKAWLRFALWGNEKYEHDINLVPGPSEKELAEYFEHL